MTGIKQSNFTQVTSVDEADNIPLFTGSENKRITYENMRNQLTDEIAVRFIYPTTAQLQQSNLEADEDEPNYVRCEETEYRLYKITALAAGVDDIVLDNGMTATYQEEYSKSGFVLGAASSTNNALALFDGTTGTQLKTGAVLSTIGGNLVSATSIAQVSYPRVDAANAVTMATPTTLKTDLNLPSNTAVSISNIEGDIATIEGDIVDINADLATTVQTVETWAAISTITPNAAGQLFTLKQHTSGGMGGGTLMAFIGSVTDDGGTQKNCLGGFYLKRINYTFLTPQMFGSLGVISQLNQHIYIQAALDAVEASKGAVFLPAGDYVLGASILLPNYVTLFGTGDGSVINNQYTLLADGLIKNKDTDYSREFSVKNLVLRGGTHGFKINVATGQDGYVLEDITFQLQTNTCFGINKLLQVNNFTRCYFTLAPFGVTCSGWTANLNNFKDCQFNSLTEGAVYFPASSEVNTFDGCRFEAGGTVGKTTIDVTDARSLNFTNCYFENCGDYLLKDNSSDNGVRFDGCHFTYVDLGSGPEQFKFSSSGIVTFGTNSWGLQHEGPAKILEIGHNNGLLGKGTSTVYSSLTRSGKSVRSKRYTTPATNTQDIVVFTKSTTVGGTTNCQSCAAKISIGYTVILAGGFSASYSRSYLVSVVAAASVLTSVITLCSAADNGGGTTLTLAEKAGATTDELRLKITLTGTNLATELSSALWWSLEYDSAAVVDTDIIDADIIV